MALGRSDWLAAALVELADGGVEAVRVEVVARRLGVTKGSFYWHFGGRDDLLQGLLDRYEQVGTAEVIDRVDAAAPDARGRLQALAKLTLGSLTVFDRAEVALRAWATMDERAAATLDRVDRRRLDYVTGLLAAAGIGRASARRRADLFYRLLIGEYLWRSHGGRALTRTARDEMVALLLAEPQPAT